jgi:hypothetical protein
MSISRGALANHEALDAIVAIAQQRTSSLGVLA